MTPIPSGPAAVCVEAGKGEFRVFGRQRDRLLSGLHHFRALLNGPYAFLIITVRENLKKG